MFWRILTIGAVCVLFMQNASCENMDKVSAYFSVENEPSVSNRVINAPLDQVSVTAQTVMSSLGYAVTVNKQGGEIRLSTKNSLGYKFTVILTEIPQSNVTGSVTNTLTTNQKTRARIEWEGGRDDQTGALILAKLEASGK